MSDYPFYQMTPGSCLRATDFNCFSQVKPLYLQNLQNGFLTADRKYHPALKYMNILNEPDLKMPSSATNGGPEGPKQMARSLISAFDAMLEAEKEAGVTGPLINFTATFSYAICAACGGFSGKPALGQMWVLDDAMHNPEKYGYTPINDISAAYEARFIHSFNTQNPATDLQHQFLDDYSAHFPTTPVYIGEYHRVHANQTEDLDMILSLAEVNPLFFGISFFQYQVAYWKMGSEQDFGMLGLGDFEVASMPYFGQTFSIYCLAPQDSPLSGMSMPNAVAAVYGGSAIDTSTLCLANPEGVALDESGYLTVLSQNSSSQMSLFVERVVNHMGATVPKSRSKQLNDLAESIVDGSVSKGSNYSMAELATYLGSKPDWVEFDSQAKCVANRNVAPHVIGSAIGWVCSHAKTFSCDGVFLQCQGSTYKTADFVFSRYYDEVGSDNPLVDCDFSGAAIYASAQLYEGWSGSAHCVSGANPVTITSTTRTASTTAATTVGPETSTTVAEADTTTTTTSVPSEVSTTTTSADAVDVETTTTSGFLEPTTSRGAAHKDTDKEVTSSSLRTAVGQQALLLLPLLLLLAASA